MDSGLGGRLKRRDWRLGGCGKASMLTVFRSVLPGVGMADGGGDDGCVVFMLGTEDEEVILAGLGIGMAEVGTEDGVFEVGKDEVVEVGIEDVMGDVDNEVGIDDDNDVLDRLAGEAVTERRTSGADGAGRAEERRRCGEGAGESADLRVLVMGSGGSGIDGGPLLGGGCNPW